jgi:hypothetical protein
MSADGDHAQETNDVDFDDDTDNQDDIVEDEGPRTTLQAAITWIMARDSEPTFSLAETELGKIGELILRAGVAPKLPVEKAWLELRGAVCDGKIEIWGDLYEAQLKLFLDPNDPAVEAQARADGIPDNWDRGGE